MHKANTPSAKKLGGGLFLVDKGEKAKSIPNNAGKTYFKWSMAERNMLLRECAYAEVWNFPQRQKSAKRGDICTILKAVPNFEETLENLDWRKCQNEYDRNVKLYTDEGEAYRFRSGDDEQHTQWQDIINRKEDGQVADDGSAQKRKVLEEDLKAAGELFRDKEVANSPKKQAMTKVL